jgi:hypothetical protein
MSGLLGSRCTEESSRQRSVRRVSLSPLHVYPALRTGWPISGEKSHFGSLPAPYPPSFIECDPAIALCIRLPWAELSYAKKISHPGAWLHNLLDCGAQLIQLKEITN